MENNFLEERSRDVKWLKSEMNQLMSLSNKLVERKRNFLIPTTAVSATIVAGLLIFMTTIHDDGGYFKLLAMFSAILFVLSVVISHLYLTILLSLESRKLDHELTLRRSTLKRYKENIRDGITDPRIYSEALALVRDERNELKYTYRSLELSSREIWFIISNILFVVAFVGLFVTFLYRIAK